MIRCPHCQCMVSPGTTCHGCGKFYAFADETGLTCSRCGKPATHLSDHRRGVFWFCSTECEDGFFAEDSPARADEGFDLMGRTGRRR